MHRCCTAQQKKNRPVLLCPLMQNVSEDFTRGKGKKEPMERCGGKKVKKGNRKRTDVCKQRREGSEVKSFNRG